MQLSNLAQQGQSIHTWHLNIAYDSIVLLLLQKRQSSRRVSCRLNLDPCHPNGDGLRQGLQQCRIIVYQ
jgi:hypothetical protein